MALYRRHWSFTGATIFYRSKQPPQDVHKNHQQWELELPTNLYYICQDVKIRERTCWTFFNVILYLRVVEARFSWPSERTIVCKKLNSVFKVRTLSNYTLLFYNFFATFKLLKPFVTFCQISFYEYFTNNSKYVDIFFHWWKIMSKFAKQRVQ